MDVQKLVVLDGSVSKSRFEEMSLRRRNVSGDKAGEAQAQEGAVAQPTEPENEAKDVRFVSNQNEWTANLPPPKFTLNFNTSMKSGSFLE